MTTGPPTFDDARRALYGGSRTAFVKRRTELAAAARRGGDRDEAKRIGALRKPTAAAHLVNLLALAGDSSLQELVELGTEIRRAMAEGNDREMRALLKGRAAAIAKARERATAIARANDESVSGVVGDQIVQTLRAAMASDDAAAAVLGGSLTEALDEPGFGGFGIDLPARAPSPRSATERGAQSKADAGRDRRAEADERRAAAESRSRAAEQVQRAEKALAAATKRHDRLQRDRDRIAAQLAQVDDELDAARAEVGDAELRLHDAVAELEAAGNAPPH